MRTNSVVRRSFSAPNPPSALNAPQKDPEILSLTGFRWFAALLVYLTHYSFSDARAQKDFPGFLWMEGHAGVGFFFVLSGFLLTYKYLEPMRRGGWDARSYYLKRVSRIYPLYFLLLGGMVTYQILIARVVVTRDYLTKVLLHLCLLQAYFEDTRFDFIPTAWSLTVEETFYLFLPIILFFVARALKGGGKNIFRLLGVLAAMNFLFIVAGFAIGWIPAKPLGFFSSSSAWFSYTIFGRFIDLSLGMLVAILLRERSAQMERFLSRGWANTICLGGLLLWALSSYAICHVSSGSFRILLHPVFSLSGALLVLSLCGRSGFAKLLSSRPLVYCGKISYALYLIHCTRSFSTWVRAWTVSVPSAPVRVALMYLILSVIAAVFYHAWEQPVQALIRRHWLKKT